MCLVGFIKKKFKGVYCEHSGSLRCYTLWRVGSHPDASTTRRTLIFKSRWILENLRRFVILAVTVKSAVSWAVIPVKARTSNMFI
jgi:hypothetical protein